MGTFKCRICGSELYFRRMDYYECANCSVLFSNKECFSLNRELKVQYLENYDLENWGELEFQHFQDSGVDLRAAIEEPITLYPYKLSDAHWAKIPFGISVEPSDFDMDIKVYCRSGLASKFGISLKNCTGVGDNHYRGQVMGFFINLSENQYTINPGDRVAQMVPEKKLFVDTVKVDSLSETERGSDGFGSTGI